MEDARRHYLDLIRHDGVRLSPALAKAFGAVPREVFVPEGFHRRDGRLVLPADPEFLRAVYSNDVLVTKLRGQKPISSSSQPSLMAVMIEALDVRPGQRILEIGAGTGYNAALLATLGAEVTTVDVQDDVADRARTALARAGITGVRVETGDGYTGGPDGRYDRIIVTVGVAGISPHWMNRLVRDGRIVAPVEHAGMHPVLTAVPAGELSVVCPAGFMSAAGPLAARHPGSHPAPPGSPLTGLEQVVAPRWGAPLEAMAYRDLWFAAGAWNRQVTYATVPGREQSLLAVVSDSSCAVVLPDGAILASSEQASEVALALSDRWWTHGRPPMSAWRAALEPAGPLLVPRTWRLHRP
ncbi:protein-L-isoaspartate O-methyltransferase family protein [Actinoplanes sp. CA-015351]|uniref:protein-L-isoaspartate O-methyltransferase family protein n=1 Tax=Actinoplanes sp. CA-015351 TaxID=3239897 RepID=UPI003D952A6C